jgi:hypothetical protein
VRAPVDPGEHVVRAAADGKRPWSGHVVVGPTADDQSIVVPVLEDAPVVAPAAGATGAPAPGSAGEGGPTATSSSPTRITGWVFGGIGIATIGVGSYFGIEAFTEWGKRNDGCPTSTTCTHDGKVAGDAAMSDATISTILFAAGAVATGVGVVLVVTSMSKGHEAPRSARLVPLLGPVTGAALVAEF